MWFMFGDYAFRSRDSETAKEADNDITADLTAESSWWWQCKLQTPSRPNFPGFLEPPVLLQTQVGVKQA